MSFTEVWEYLECSLITSETMRRICWPAWISALSMVAFVLLASGCQANTAIVPPSVFEQVNADGREWTYDTAWQNIRALNQKLEGEEIDTISDDALFITSQMERLERGKAGPMRSGATARLVEDFVTSAQLRSFDENVQHLKVAGLKLQDTFDEGDFPSAKVHALEVHVVARTLHREQ
jgi:hypothetical protein